MSYGTSDTTVISSIKTEAHNLNAIDASAASRDDSSPAPFPTTTPKNRQLGCFRVFYNRDNKESQQVTLILTPKTIYANRKM